MGPSLMIRASVGRSTCVPTTLEKETQTDRISKRWWTRVASGRVVPGESDR